MTTQYTVDTIRDLPSDEFELIGFNLSGKVAGRIASLSMSLAGTQVRRAQHLDESDQAGIDNFNDQMNALDQLEAQNEFFANAGMETPVNKEDQLRAWLGVRHMMIERGFKPSPLSENFKYMVEMTIKRNNPTDEEIDALVASSDLSEKQMRDIYKAKSARAIDDTIEVAKHAMTIINSIEPDVNTTPDGFNDIVHAAIASSQKSAVVRGNDVTESVANLMILKAMENAS